MKKSVKDAVVPKLNNKQLDEFMKKAQRGDLGAKLTLIAHNQRIILDELYAIKKKG